MARSGAAATDHCSRQQLSAAKAGDEGLSEHTGNSTVYCGTLLFHPQRSHGLFGSERLHTTVGEESRGRRLSTITGVDPMALHVANGHHAQRTRWHVGLWRCLATVESTIDPA